jgi:hypothetical protein
MTTRSRRAITLVLVAALTILLLPGVASAPPAETATLTMVSDPGDYVGQGQTWSYDTAAGDVISATTNGNTLNAAVTGFNGDWWYLDFDAPNGQTLTAGTTYANATRYPFNGSGPGLSISGEGRGCNELTGSFTVTEATFGGPDSSYVQDFVATFEQHCEGAEPALRGTVSIHNPPAPEPLELGVTVAGDGTVSRVTGRATVHGTVTCSGPVTVNLNGTLTQVVKKTILSGTLGTQVACTPGAPVSWQAVAVPNGTTPFGRGDAEAEVTASAQDPNFGGTVTDTATQVVRLRRA